MPTPETPAQRRARMLVRIGDLSLELAEDLQAGAIGAEDPAQKVSLAAQFHRAARGLRQTLAIEARLERDAVRHAREDDDAAAGRAARACETRKTQVRADLERRVCREVGPREAEAWLADLNERLDEEALYDGFTDEDVDAHIERLSGELGLTGEAKHAYVPRACRARVPERRFTSEDIARMFPALAGDGDGDGDDDEDEDLDEDFDDDEDLHEASAQTPPEDPLHPAAQGPPPTGEAGVEPPPPDIPEPPPQPPPQPYIPPWERNPHARYPGGSGW